MNGLYEQIKENRKYDNVVLEMFLWFSGLVNIPQNAGGARFDRCLLLFNFFD